MTDRPALPRLAPVRGGPHPPLIADPIVASFVFLVVVSLFFRAFPGVDLWFSGLFYDPASGFPVTRLGAFIGVRTFSDWLLRLTVLLLVLPLVVKLARPSRPMPVAPQKLVFLLSRLALGPGLVVNAILKETWGRPRPRMVDLFGGDLPFVPAWQISDYCTSNCSFVSGEASTAVWFVGLALVAPPAWRKTVAVAAITVAIVVSLNRVAFGAHFLSDVVVAWALTLFLIAVLYRFTIARPPPWLDNDILEERWAGWGRRLHRVLAPRPKP